MNMCMYDSFFLRLDNSNTGWPVIGQLIVISLPQGTAFYTRLIADGIEKSAFWFKPRSLIIMNLVGLTIFLRTYCAYCRTKEVGAARPSVIRALYTHVYTDTCPPR